MSLLKAQPQRIACAVIAQTIGRVGAMPATCSANFKAWVQTLQDHPEATMQVLDAFYHLLQSVRCYGGSPQWRPFKDWR